jgi:8-oxo-dGTP diphosphatase
MATPTYITELREVWGHRPLLLPGVSGVVLRGDPGHEQVLLGRRSDTGRWSVPAGIVEPGEQPAISLARELWEETRVRVVVERLVSVVADREITYPNGDRCQFLSMTFRCRHTAGEGAVGDEESLAVGWFDVDGLPDDLSERGRERIAAALSDEPADDQLVPALTRCRSRRTSATNSPAPKTATSTPTPTITGVAFRAAAARAS